MTLITGSLALGSGTSAAFVELVGNGYARQTISFSTYRGSQSGTFYNDQQVGFTASADWLPITQIGVVDAFGTLVFFWQKDSRVLVVAGNSYGVSAKGLQITLEDVASKPSASFTYPIGSIIGHASNNNNIVSACDLSVVAGALATYQFSGTIAPSHGGTGAISITQAPYNCSVSNPDNASGLQAAINAAITAGVPLFIPAAQTGSGYKYTAPLTISGNLTIIGNSITQNWAGGINVPLGSPPLSGSLLCPSSNGSDAIVITGTSTQVNIRDIGILFQTPFVGTGDGIHYVPGQDVQGLSGSRWDNVYVYGHDGNHYAVNLTNPLLNTFSEIYSYGGGVLKLYGNASTTNYYGNCVFIHVYGQVVVGGSANGFDLQANGPQRINLNIFIRPQAIIDSIPGIYPAGNPPTSAQYIWYQDDNVQTTSVIAPDIETNLGSSMRLGAQGANNYFDWSGLGTDSANIYASAWTTNGIMYGPRTKTFTDTTSSGAGGNTGIFAFPSTHVNASNVTVYPVLATLYVSPPISGTNVSATRISAIYATGEIFTTSDLGATGGAFISGGTINLNQNSNFAVNIGTGSTTSTVSIGGANNNVTIGKTTAIGTTQTVGFPIIPTMAGAPTGVVAAGAMVFDTTNSKLMISTGSGWKGVVVS